MNEPVNKATSNSHHSCNTTTVIGCTTGQSPCGSSKEPSLASVQTTHTLHCSECCIVGIINSDIIVSNLLYWNGQLVWTPALSTLFVGDRGLYPAGIIAHLRLYRHIRQAAIRDVFLFAVGSHAVITYFGWLGLALYNIVVRIMVRVDVRVRVTQGL